MYCMLCGYPPFFAETEAGLLKLLRRGEYTFPEEDWDEVSSDAKDLITGLLQMCPDERFTADEALHHDWIKLKAPRASNVALSACNHLVDKLRAFRAASALKKAALHIMANRLNMEQIEALRDTFNAFDENGDGLLSGLDLKKGLDK